MVPNAPKQYKTHQNISLGSNGVDQVRSLQKIPTRLRGTNFCTSSARFVPSFVTQPNGPKCTQIVGNAPKHQFRVQWGGSGAFISKNSDTTSWHELLHQFGPFCTVFRKANQMVPNAPKQQKTHQNISLGSNGVDRVRSLRKIQTRLCVTNICTSSACFAPSFINQPNYPKCTQIVQNTPKHDFWMQWGGSGAFVAKNFDATSWKRTFCTSSAHFAPSFIRQTIVPNTPEQYKMRQNMSLGSNGVEQVRSLRKIPTRLCVTNFCTSSARFAPSFVRQLNDPKWTQIVQNTPKHQFRVQWG